jgi:hypothetical protein
MYDVTPRQTPAGLTAMCYSGTFCAQHYGQIARDFYELYFRLTRNITYCKHGDLAVISAGRGPNRQQHTDKS